MSITEKKLCTAALAAALLDKIESLHVYPSSLPDMETATGLAVLLHDILNADAMESSVA